jgi:hypothetical protein
LKIKLQSSEDCAQLILYFLIDLSLTELICSAVEGDHSNSSAIVNDSSYLSHLYLNKEKLYSFSALLLEFCFHSPADAQELINQNHFPLNLIDIQFFVSNFIQRFTKDCSNDAKRMTFYLDHPFLLSLLNDFIISTQLSFLPLDILTDFIK